MNATYCKCGKQVWGKTTCWLCIARKAKDEIARAEQLEHDQKLKRIEAKRLKEERDKIKAIKEMARYK